MKIDWNVKWEKYGKFSKDIHVVGYPDKIYPHGGDKDG